MRCSCPDGPRCESRACTDFADWSVQVPQWGERHETFKFMCDWHKQMYVEAWTKRMPGIDPPERSGMHEDWRPSLFDMINHARFAMAYEERRKQADPYGREAQRQLLRRMSRR